MASTSSGGNSRGGKPPANKKVGKPRTLHAPSEVVDHETPQSAADSEPTERTVNSWLSAIKLVVGGVLVVGLTGLMFWTVYRYALTTPRFAVQNVEVIGNQRLSRTKVAEIAGIRVGQNIFATDMATLQQRLLDEPWIRTAQVTRDIPNALQIKISEHEAVALANLDGVLFLATSAGEPFRQVLPGEAFDLPLITGLSSEELTRDRKREVERIGVATDVLKQYARLDQSRVHVAQEVHLQDDGRVTLIVGVRGLHLELGRDNFRKKLQMAGRVLAELGSKGGQPEAIFLDNETHPERVVVRLR
jgi:cell division protein FtsQ